LQKLAAAGQSTGCVAPSQENCPADARAQLDATQENRLKPAMPRRLPDAKLCTMSSERRAQTRQCLALPVRLGDGSCAVTRDVSASGMYFELDGPYRLGAIVDFELEWPPSRIKFTAVAQLVRVEQLGARTGIAVRWIAPRLQRSH
jgi:hypothetical protein